MSDTNTIDIDKLTEDMAEFTAEEMAKQKKSLAQIIDSYRKTITSIKFDRKTREEARSLGVKHSVIKNAYANNILNKIGETTGCVIEIIGDAFNCLVKFLAHILQSAMDMSVTLLVKIVDVISFRK